MVLGLFIPLSLRPLHLGAIQLDTNSLLISSMMMIVGFQISFFGVFTRLYCMIRGLLPQWRELSWLLQPFALEQGLLAGLGVLLVGVVLLASAIWNWKLAGFGPLSYPESLRIVIPSMTFFTLGVQMMFSSFFLGILTLKHD